MARWSHPRTLLVLLALCGGHAQAIKVTIPLPGATNSYAECVLGLIEADTGAVQTQAIVSSCRSRFPGPSSRGLLGPRSIDACYRKNKRLVSHRESAKAVFGACQDYFRAGSLADNSALQGSRLH